MSAILADRACREAQALPVGRGRRTRKSLCVVGSGLLALALATGCSSTRDSLHYNRWAPTNGGPSVLNRAEWLHDAPERALNNLDERIENVIY